MSEVRRSKSLKRELSDEILATVIDSNTGNTYRTGKFLGKGGFAKVHEIINLKNNVTYAAKIIPKAKVTKKYQITKVAREIMLHRDLVHKNVVTLESYFEDIDHVYIILENCPNQSLVHLMKKQVCFSLHDTKYYVSQLIAGTKYIHSKNIIHRDLKPGNMFLSANMTVKIGDFGLAVTASSITGPVMLCGTPNYIAPEVLSKTNVSYKIDVWAIGCTIYCLLFGVPPYESSTLDETYRRIESNIWNKNKVKGDFQLLDLLEGILKTDYNERMSISDIERHPFFSDNPNDLTLEQIDLNYNEEDTNPELLQNSMRANSDQEIYNKINDAILTKTLTLDSKSQKTSVNRGISFKRIMQNLFQRKKVISSKSNSGDKNDFMICDEDDKSNVQNNERDIMIKYELTNKRGGGAQISNNHNKLTNCFDQKNSHSLPYGYQQNNIKSNEILLRVIEKICDRTKSSCQDVHYLLGLNVVFVSKWIDYSNKYGFGYQLTNNTTGVLFNDNTTMTVSAKDNNKSLVQYVDYSGNITSYHASEIPNNLREKHTYTLYFREYMERKLTDGAASHRDLWPDHIVCSDNRNITVKRWIRTSGEIIMELSNGTVQVNFLVDHSKMVLSFIPPEMWQNITLIAKTSKPFILPVEKPQDPQTYDINSVALTYINSNRQLVHFRAIDLNYPWSKTVEPLIGRLNYVRLVLEEFSRLD